MKIAFTCRINAEPQTTELNHSLPCFRSKVNFLPEIHVYLETTIYHQKIERK